MRDKQQYVAKNKINGIVRYIILSAIEPHNAFKQQKIKNNRHSCKFTSHASKVSIPTNSNVNTQEAVGDKCFV